MRISLCIFFIFFVFHVHAQHADRLLSKAVQRVYNEYKLFFDSAGLSKYVVLDKTKSYLVNSKAQKIRTIARADSSFAFDEFSLSFVFVYKGDTITHLAPCRLDTLQTLLPLGTPGNPIRHGDVLPPYQELVRGNIPFNYKKLKKLLQQMKLEFTAVNLQSLPFGGTDKTAANHAGEKLQYMWVVTTACPEIKCRQLQISATNGKMLADKYPE